MQHAAATNPSTNIPPIVLLVDDDRDTLDMYASVFESEGICVSTCTRTDEAMCAIDDLKPDLVVTDIGFDGVDLGVQLVESLKTGPRTHAIPVVVLTGRTLAELPPQMTQEADLCLAKPVMPSDLLHQVRALLQKSADARARTESRPTGTTAAAQPGKRPTLVTAQRRRAASRARNCPQCGATLPWIERGRIGGVEYDYYQWCRNGCGLYCFDRVASTWLRLA